MTRRLFGDRAARILLAEDNRADVVLTREAFRQLEVEVVLDHVETGEQCLDFLRRRGDYADSESPDLVILDLNMPVLDGREVLAAIIGDDDLRHLPVIVLTTSRDVEDVRRMYQLRCSSYITKPVDFDEFVDIAANVVKYWFGVVDLPTAPPRQDTRSS